MEISELFLYLRTVSYLIIAFLSIITYRNDEHYVSLNKIKGFLLGVFMISMGLLLLTFSEIIGWTTAYQDLRTWILTPSVVIAMISVIVISFFEDRRNSKKL